MSTSTLTVVSAEVSLHEGLIPLYEENGLIGIADGVALSFKVEMNRSKEVVSATATFGGEEVRITLAQFAAIYDAQPLLSDSVLDLHGIKVDGAVLVDGTAALRLANDQAAAKAAALAQAKASKRAAEAKASPTKSPKARARGKVYDPDAAEPPQSGKAERHAAFAESRVPQQELVEALERLALEPVAGALGLAGITSLRALMLHSVDDVEESLKRPTVYGAKYKLSVFQRRQLASLGLDASPHLPVAVAAPKGLPSTAYDIAADGEEGDEASSLEQGLGLLSHAKQDELALMRAIGLDERRYGAHSLRIGGATAALAAGLSPATIRAAGRWSSDIYLIYCRISKESAAGVATCIGSTPFEDLERGAQFIGEELVLAAWEAPRAVELFVEKSMIDDLCDEDIM
jgi:hypothetical protein